MNKEFLDAIEANPIIAAVKDEQGLQNCLGREAGGYLYGRICTGRAVKTISQKC